MNPVYRSSCERVIRKLLEHYKDNPAVIGWQIDNETSAGGAANPDVQAGFVQYLQSKFQTVDELNKIWGLNYWGQRLNDWTEIPPQAGIINPGWKLEWERYQQWMTTDFLAWVEAPVAVRCAWADGPECNLFNAEGLPASPFRTDDWPGVTKLGERGSR